MSGFLGKESNGTLHRVIPLCFQAKSSLCDTWFWVTNTIPLLDSTFTFLHIVEQKKSLKNLSNTQHNKELQCLTTSTIQP